MKYSGELHVSSFYKNLYVANIKIDNKFSSSAYVHFITLSVFETRQTYIYQQSEERERKKKE